MIMHNTLQNVANNFICIIAVSVGILKVPKITDCLVNFVLD